MISKPTTSNTTVAKEQIEHQIPTGVLQVRNIRVSLTSKIYSGSNLISILQSGQGEIESKSEESDLNITSHSYILEDSSSDSEEDIALSEENPRTFHVRTAVLGERDSELQIDQPIQSTSQIQPSTSKRKATTLAKKAKKPKLSKNLGNWRVI